MTPFERTLGATLNQSGASEKNGVMFYIDFRKAVMKEKLPLSPIFSPK
jgi:hypothetical protein